VKEGEGSSNDKKNNVKGGDVKNSNATPYNKADDFNPSYVLCRASDGHVYAKFVGQHRWDLLHVHHQVLASGHIIFGSTIKQP